MSVNLSSTTPAAPSGSTNVTFQTDGSGNISGYLPTSSSVAASVDLTGQTADISGTTLLAVAADGFYRISGYIIVTTVDGASSTLPSIVITWTDVNNNTGQSFTLTPTDTGNLLTTVDQAVMAVNAKASSNIQYSTSGYTSGTPSTMTFALRIVLEAL